MTVALDPSVTFHFVSPLSITLLVVSNEESAPKPLKLGEYGVIVFAEKGNASAKFTIAA